MAKNKTGVLVLFVEISFCIDLIKQDHLSSLHSTGIQVYIHLATKFQPSTPFSSNDITTIFYRSAVSEVINV